MNNLFNLLGGNQNLLGQFGNMQNLIQQFNQFKSTFKGDAKQQVQQLLNSGQMSQQQYNYLQGLAQQFQNMLNK